MESYAPQKAADYQRLILFCYGSCYTVVTGAPQLNCVLPECCHGSRGWDDDSKNRPKRCHGSTGWDDDSSEGL